MSHLSALKVASLKSLLTVIGARTSGTKAELISRLNHGLKTPKLHLRDNGQATRILSVDMGIKNLAFCVCDAQKHIASQKTHLRFLEWKRVNVLDSSNTDTMQSTSEAASDAFGPAELSKRALWLVRDVLGPYKPDTILIERQRFRSGGGSAVQEWTLRVNMFESMIWALFRAFDGGGSTGDSAPDLWPVNPKQVASFWIDDLPSSDDSHLSRSKIEKRQKIDLVYRWLAHDENNDWVKGTLDFVEGAADTKRAFLAAMQAKSSRKHRASQISDTQIVKLDDVADCLLQAAAWCRWEENRAALEPLLGKSAKPGVVLEKVKSWLVANGRSAP